VADVTPINQPPQEDLLNALTIAEMGKQGHYSGPGDAPSAFADVARLIRHALEGLSEPNAAAIRAARTFTDGGPFGGSPALAVPHEADDYRRARDCAAAILHAQLKGQ
jgi:hypothetical protein